MRHEFRISVKGNGGKHINTQERSTLHGQEDHLDFFFFSCSSKLCSAKPLSTIGTGGCNRHTIEKEVVRNSSVPVSKFANEIIK